MLKYLHPIRVRQCATEEQRTHAWEIVKTYGTTHLARFALFEDKLYFFSSGGSMIAFALEKEVAIVLGDPIGPKEDLANCLTEFIGFCSRNGWRPIFYQVLPDHLVTYAVHNFNYFCIGHDAVIDLSMFSLDGRESKNIRNSFYKMIRLGHTIQVCNPPHSPSLMHELYQVSDEWLSNRGGFEIGFSIGRLDERYLNTCSIILVRNQDGCAEAFANLILVEQRRHEVSVDLMRYRPGSHNGQMDYLFVSAIQWAQDWGFDTFNLGFSPFIGIGKEPRSPIIERTLRFIHEHTILGPNFKGLYFFKEKFNPTWSPRYLVYPGLISLPSVAINIMRAYKVDHLIGQYLFKYRYEQLLGYLGKK